MDKIDRQLINLMQKDATLTTAELADQVGLSA
ncbi:AsnC family protein, partial [Vibrio alginolyticus]